MGKKILDSKALYVVLSVIIAVALWFYVVSLDGNEDTWTISNIPVQFVGLDMLENRNLMIVGDPPTVSLRITAPFSTRANLDAESITVTVDVSSISGPQESRMGYTVTFPSEYAKSIKEWSQTPLNVTFTVARRLTREIEVRGVFEGTVAEGYLRGGNDDFEFSPDFITVSGQEELVNQIAYAQVVVTGDELTEAVSGDYTFQFISNSGEELNDLDVECGVETVYASFPVWATAEIPLLVNFIDGGGTTGQNVKYDIDHDSIIIFGSKDDVAGISAVELEAIDLATVRDGDVITRRIPLANELNNLSGYTEVSITVHLPSLTTKSVETARIDWIYPPEGWDVTLVTQALTVDVRGPRDELETISGENIRVVVNLSEITLAAGQYRLPVQFYLDSVGTTEAGVLDPDSYYVVVSLSPAPTE